MWHAAYTKLVSLIVLPAFLLAQLFCACHAAAAVPLAAPLPATDSKHACHSHHTPRVEAPNHCGPTQGRVPAPNDSECPHCSGESAQIISSERVIAPDLEPVLLPFEFSSPTLQHLPPLSLAARLQAFTPWLADLSPPPDLLRVKCSLQI